MLERLGGEHRGILELPVRLGDARQPEQRARIGAGFADRHPLARSRLQEAVLEVHRAEQLVLLALGQGRAAEQFGQLLERVEVVARSGGSRGSRRAAAWPRPAGCGAPDSGVPLAMSSQPANVSSSACGTPACSARAVAACALGEVVATAIRLHSSIRQASPAYGSSSAIWARLGGGLGVVALVEERLGQLDANLRAGRAGGQHRAVLVCGRGHRPVPEQGVASMNRAAGVRSGTRVSISRVTASAGRAGAQQHRRVGGDNADDVRVLGDAPVEQLARLVELAARVVDSSASAIRGR